MSFSDEWAAFRAKRRTQIPPDSLAVIDGSIQGLRESGILDGCLSKGDRAPNFRGVTAFGEDRELGVLLENGSVVLAFYRGGWCPYCNLELRSLQQALSDVQALGATLVAVSPEVLEASLATSQKNEVTFDVISDRGNAIARQFGLVFQLGEDMRESYRGLGHDLPKSNGDDSYEIPVPATYVIDRDFTIRMAYLNVDHMYRVDPEEILAALRAIAGKG